MYVPRQLAIVSRETFLQVSHHFLNYPTRRDHTGTRNVGNYICSIPAGLLSNFPKENSVGYPAK